MRPIEFNLPFLGTTVDDDTFQYFLVKITPQSALISVLSEFALPTERQNTCKVCLHADGFLQLKKNLEFSLDGIAVKLINSDIDSVYKVVFKKTLPNMFFFQKTEIDTIPLPDLNLIVIELIKDSLLLKEGINVYFKHLIPYFSRILLLSSKNFNELKEFILSDTQRQIQENINKIKVIYSSLLNDCNKEINFYDFIDLDLLRSVLNSEINMTLLKLSCAGIDDISMPTEFSEVYSIHSYKAYLKSIKTLEYRLYNNYNTIVFIYIFCIKKFISTVH
jgi:hypothetical protein